MVVNVQLMSCVTPGMRSYKSLPAMIRKRWIIQAPATNVSNSDDERYPTTGPTFPVDPFLVQVGVHALVKDVINSFFDFFDLDETAAPCATLTLGIFGGRGD